MYMYMYNCKYEYFGGCAHSGKKTLSVNLGGVHL